MIKYYNSGGHKLCKPGSQNQLHSTHICASDSMLAFWRIINSFTYLLTNLLTYLQADWNAVL